MSSVATKEPAYYKLELGEEEKKKLEGIFSTMEKDPQTIDFLTPVDYEALGILDYPTIITQPMDLGTVRTKLQNGEYKLFQDIITSFNNPLLSVAKIPISTIYDPLISSYQ